MNYGEIASVRSMPLTAIIVGAVFLVIGIASIIFGALMLTDVLDKFLDDLLVKYPELDPIIKYGAILFVVGGLINTLTGAGFFLSWKGAYYLAIIMLVAGIAASIAFILLSDYTISDNILIMTIVTIVIMLMMLLSMFVYSTRSYFLG